MPEVEEVNDKVLVELIFLVIGCQDEIVKILSANCLGPREEQREINLDTLWNNGNNLTVTPTNKQQTQQQQQQRTYHWLIQVKFEDNESKKKLLKNGPKIRI